MFGVSFGVDFCFFCEILSNLVTFCAILDFLRAPEGVQTRFGWTASYLVDFGEIGSSQHEVFAPGYLRAPNCQKELPRA